MHRFAYAIIAGMLSAAGANADSAITLGGRELSCATPRGRAIVELDDSLPSEGASAWPNMLLMNPDMLDRLPAKVQWFIFAHECGHLQKEDNSELDADEYAVRTGVEQGWLTIDVLQQVCDSWEHAPETDTHPSGLRRCEWLADKWREYSHVEVDE